MTNAQEPQMQTFRWAANITLDDVSEEEAEMFLQRLRQDVVTIQFSVQVAPNRRNYLSARVELES